MNSNTYGALVHVVMRGQSGVYQIINAINGKTYVGSTNCLARRWPEHRRKLRAGISTCTRLQSAWNKYGDAVFSFSVLEIVQSGSDLLAREQYWMDRMQPAYNVAPVAGSQAGIKHSAETRALLARLAKPITDDHRAKMVAGLRNMTPEAKALQRARQSISHMGNKNMLGKTQSLESNSKRSATQKGRIFSLEHRAKLSAARRALFEARRNSMLEVA